MVLPRTGQGKIIGWFLPLYSVPRVMKHMLACKAEGTLIVPRWSSSPYWPMIFRQNLVYQDYITDFIGQRSILQNTRTLLRFHSSHVYYNTILVLGPCYPTDKTLKLLFLKPILAP
jgi:hypothetical protein